MITPSSPLSWKIRNIPECYLSVTCGNCGHKAELSIKTIVDNGHGEKLIREVLKTLKCSKTIGGRKCGSDPSSVVLKCKWDKEMEIELLGSSE